MMRQTLCLLLVALATLWTNASTMPRWFQRSPTLPDSSKTPPSSNTTTTAPSNTSKKPYWLQKAMNNSTRDDKNGSSKDRSKKRKDEDRSSNRKDQEVEGTAPGSTSDTPPADDDTKQEPKSNPTGKDTATGSEDPTPVESSPETTSGNQTATPATPPRHQPFRPHPMFRQQQQQRQPGIIVMGSPPGSHTPGGQMRPGSSPVLNDAIGQILSTAVRLGLVTWISKHLMHQEEAVVPSQQFVWEVLNEKYERDVKALKSVLKRPPRGLRPSTWRAIVRRFQGTAPHPRRILANLYRRTVIIVDMSTSAKASDSHNIPLEQLPDLVSFLIQQQKLHAFGTDKTTGEPLELEVVINMESPGGSATLFGKAAAELTRFRQNCPQLTLTVCVDQIAASGGYMMASQADRIVAAPFAIVGSIGVIREGFNFYELAKRYGIQPLVLKSGDSKNPVSSFGPITRQDMELEQVRLKKVHQAFQDFVIESRPQISARIMDGSIFSGGEAYDLGLIDEIQTSEDYIFQRVENGDRVLRLHRSGRKTMRRLSTMDLLPHLVKFVSKVSDQANVKNLIRVGTWLSFAHHLIQKYRFFGI